MHRTETLTEALKESDGSLKFILSSLETLEGLRPQIKSSAESSHKESHLFSLYCILYKRSPHYLLWSTLLGSRGQYDPSSPHETKEVSDSSNMWHFAISAATTLNF